MPTKRTKKKATSQKSPGTSQTITFSPKILVEPTQTVDQKVSVKQTVIDWRPLIVWLAVVVLIAALGFFAFEYFFPKPVQQVQDELVGAYGPYDVYKADEHQYSMQINPEVIWTFRANPIDTVSVPEFPFKKDFKAALADVKEVWIALAPEEDVRAVVSATEIAKTLGAQRYEVHSGWLRQPVKCAADSTLPVCSEPIIPLDFANENRTVFRILGPVDKVEQPAIYVMGNTIIIQAPDYDSLDLVAVKAVLLMLNLA